MYVHMCMHVYVGMHTYINIGVRRDQRALDNLELEL